MYEKMTQQFVEEAQRLAQPFNAIRDLTIENIDRVAHFQVNVAREYTEMGLAEIREGVGIKQPEQLQEYFGHATEKAERLGKKVTEDGRALAAMGEQYVTELQKIAETNVEAWKKQLAA